MFTIQEEVLLIIDRKKEKSEFTIVLCANGKNPSLNEKNQKVIEMSKRWCNSNGFTLEVIVDADYFDTEDLEGIKYKTDNAKRNKVGLCFHKNTNFQNNGDKIKDLVILELKRQRDILSKAVSDALADKNSPLRGMLAAAFCNSEPVDEYKKRIELLLNNE